MHGTIVEGYYQGGLAICCIQGPLKHEVKHPSGINKATDYNQIQEGHCTQQPGKRPVLN